jgi:hypothetical protein
MDLTRRRVRYIAGSAAAAMAAIYYLIGLGVLNIGGSTTGEMVDLGVFGGGAGTAFLILAALLFTTDRRWIWAIALVFQVFVYLIYVTASGGRDPAFEMWGITLRLLQLPVLIGLIYLSIRPTHRSSAQVGGTVQ